MRLNNELSTHTSCAHCPLAGIEIVPVLDPSSDTGSHKHFGKVRIETWA